MVVKTNYPDNNYEEPPLVVDVHARIPQGRSVEVVVNTVVYRGHVEYSIREFTWTGERWIPTRRGVRLKPEMLAPAIGGLMKAAAFAGIDVSKLPPTTATER